MNIISPLTLLVIPIIGSIMILAFPYPSKVAPDFSDWRLAAEPLKEREVRGKSIENYISFLPRALAGKGPIAALARERSDNRLDTVMNVLIVEKELELKNSNLKKIAI